MTTQVNAANINNEQPLDKIIAVVNDTPIMETELSDAIDTIKKQIAASNTPVPTDAVLRKQTLQQLIDKKIQLQLADQAGMKVSDDDLTKAITRIAQQNNLPLEQLYSQVETQGLSVSDYRKEIREEMLIQEVQQHEVGAKIMITPQEINDFTRSKAWHETTNKEYHLEDILIALPDSPTSQQIQEAKNQADTLLTKIHNGLAFREAAMANSSDQKALKGGDLGWRKLPEIPSAFAEKIIHMKDNDIVGPIQTGNGFHILHLAGSHDLASNEAPSSKQIQQLLYQRKFEEAQPAWLAKIRSQAFINMHPES